MSSRCLKHYWVTRKQETIGVFVVVVQWLSMPLPLIGLLLGSLLQRSKWRWGCFMNDLYWILISLVIPIRGFYFRWIFFLSSLPMSLHYWKKIHLRVWNLKLENSLFAGCYSWWERSRPQLMASAPPPFSWAPGGRSFQILRRQRAAAVERLRFSDVGCGPGALHCQGLDFPWCPVHMEAIEYRALNSCGIQSSFNPVPVAPGSSMWA